MQDFLLVVRNSWWTNLSVVKAVSPIAARQIALMLRCVSIADMLMTDLDDKPASQMPNLSVACSDITFDVGELESGRW